MWLINFLTIAKAWVIFCFRLFIFLFFYSGNVVLVNPIHVHRKKLTPILTIQTGSFYRFFVFSFRFVSFHPSFLPVPSFLVSICLCLRCSLASSGTCCASPTILATVTGTSSKQPSEEATGDIKWELYLKWSELKRNGARMDGACGCCIIC